MSTLMEAAERVANLGVLQYETVRGISLATWRTLHPVPDTKLLYVAGPMRGYALWNFPAFDDARDRLLGLGYSVISPADLDRERGFEEQMTTFDGSGFAIAMEYDIRAILIADGIYFLRGWEDSTGAKIAMKEDRKVNGELYVTGNALGRQLIFQPGAKVGGVESKFYPSQAGGGKAA